MLPLQEFIDYIHKNSLFTKDSKVLLTVSGGKDSVLMVHLFKLAGYNFGIAHCNFNLRGEESQRDESFVKLLAGSLDVPYHVQHFSTKKYASLNKVSTQMAARDLRYQWFEVIREKFNYDAIALAHHHTDVIETVLLNLVRGTGISGLHGILPKRNYCVRPLLFLTREQINHYVEINKIDYVEDSSNLKADYARNKIRLKVIPQLKQINPGLEHTFEQNIQRFTDTEVVLKQVVDKLRRKLLTQEKGNILISTEELKKLNPKQLLSYELLKPYGFSESVVRDMLAGLDHLSGTSYFSPTHRITLNRGMLILSESKNEERIGHVLLHSDDISITFNHCQLAVSYSRNPSFSSRIDQAYVDADLLIFPLVIRSWQVGDRFVPLGMKGIKKISDFLIDQKVAVIDKGNIPLLINGNGELIWVCGMRQDNRYKVTGTTKKVAIFELRN